jgi:tetratricopeptide (TPR) repeat protein
MTRFTCLLTALALFLFARCADGDTKGAGVAADKTTADIPKLLDRAEALRHGEEWDKVQNYYGTNSAELRRDPNNWEARLRLAEVFIQEARVTGEHPHYYPAALQMLKPVVAALEGKNPPGPRDKDVLFRALSHQASVELSLHDFVTARRTAEKAIAINPHNAYIYGCLVDACVELGAYRQAVEMCDKMVSIRPDLRSYARVSYLRELHGDLPGAIEAMEMAVKAGYPGAESTEWARLQLGHLHEVAGRPDDAKKQYELSLSYRPDYPFALAALGDLAERQKDYAAAEKLWKQASAIIPEVGFYINLAKLYRATGRPAEADELIAQIRTMIAEDMAAGHNMRLEAGHFELELTGDLAAARRYAEQEYAQRPDNLHVNQLLAAVALAEGQREQARRYAEKAAATGSKDPELLELKKELNL